MFIFAATSPPHKEDTMSGIRSMLIAPITNGDPSGCPTAMSPAQWEQAQCQGVEVTMNLNGRRTVVRIGPGQTAEWIVSIVREQRTIAFMYVHRSGA